MTQPFSFRLLATDGRARRGEIVTPHGVVRTPAFMPVGTLGTVKAMFMDDVRATGEESRRLLQEVRRGNEVIIENSDQVAIVLDGVQRMVPLAA